MTINVRPTRTVLFFLILFMVGAIVSAQKLPAKPPTCRFWSSGGVYVARVEVPGKYYPEETYYISTDGTNFERTLETGLLMENGITKFSFRVPATDREGVLLMNDKSPSLKLDGKVLGVLNLDPVKLKFKPFPQERLVRNLLRGADGTFVLVSEDKYPTGEPYSDIKLFVGKLPGLREVAITDRSFTRCGAYTLETSKGAFDYHTPDVVAETPATWLGQRLQEVNDDDFIIDEKGATVTLKSKR